MNKEGIVVLLEDSKCRVAMQLRDDRPVLAYSNCWGLFGGWMENGESPLAATIREIKEELGCRLDAGKLSYLKSHFEKDSAIIAHIFHYPVTHELDQAVLMEGQAFQFMALADLAGRKVIPLHLAILEWYFQEHQKSS